jgi:hypothetical protein
LSETISCIAARKAAVGAIRSKLDRGYDRVADQADAEHRRGRDFLDRMPTSRCQTD